MRKLLFAILLMAPLTTYGNMEESASRFMNRALPPGWFICDKLDDMMELFQSRVSGDISQTRLLIKTLQEEMNAIGEPVCGKAGVPILTIALIESGVIKTFNGSYYGHVFSITTTGNDMGYVMIIDLKVRYEGT